MKKDYNPKDYVMYFSSLDDATFAYHFETFKYRRTHIEFGIVDMTDGIHAVMENEVARELGWTFIDPPELEFEKLSFDRFDEIYDKELSNNQPSFWKELEMAFAFTDRDLFIFLIQKQFPIDRYIRFNLAQRQVNTDNRFIGKQEAYALWSWEDSDE